MQGGLLFYEKMEVSVAKLNKANLKKTLYYLQRNGLRETWISVRERLTETDRYFFVPCSEAELEKQSRRMGEADHVQYCGTLISNTGSLSE